MGWPYRFIMDLSPAEKQLRREALDRYALYAQLSAVVPVLLGILYRVAKSALKSKNAYSSVPNPSLKNRDSGGWSSTVRKVRWWLGDEMAPGKPMGTRDQWVLGVSWAAWMLVLSVVGTGQDYLHFTKRLGIVAASQYPIQYLLALKALNPFAYALGSSHEQVNKYHRVLGRVIALLLTLHAVFYFNFFIQNNLLAKRMTAPIVRAGFVSFVLTHILNGSAQRPIRALSYRLFFVIHLFVAFVTPALLCIHAPPARPFFAEALVVFVADLITRKLDTAAATATLTPLPSTNLIKVVASLPAAKLTRFRAAPGSHIYLSLPSSSPAVLFALLFNPFTVAATDPAAGTITLVARRRAGPLTAALAAAGAEKLPLAIEGPYGVAARFPHLVSGAYDRVLLVAGGIGATFTVPLYRALAEEGVKAEMVWVVRGQGEVAWAMTTQEGGLLEEENVSVFVTGSEGGAGMEGASGVEMEALRGGRRRSNGAVGGQQHVGPVRGRPDLKKVVDGVFRGGPDERVAVLVCGPAAMARELREHVGVWARKGREVYWHNEGFGF